MLQFPLKTQTHNRTASNQTTNNNEKDVKSIELKNVKTNFLYDVIMPNTVDVQNMKIIKKYKASNSPESISQKIVEIKKSKIQKKIQTIVNRNSQQMEKNMNNFPQATKFKKQNIKNESQFGQNYKYKKIIFEQEIPMQKMKLVKQTFILNQDKQNKSLLIKSAHKSEHMNQDIFQEEKQSPFIIEMDQKLGEMRKMEQEAFQPFKQKIKKVIEKTINTGVNGKVNSLMQKVNFYLTSISQSPAKSKIKKISIDVQANEKKIKSYCDEIQKGAFVKSKNRIKRDQNHSQLKQYRSKSSLTKIRPFTANISARTGLSTKEGTLSSRSRPNSSYKLDRYSKSTAEFNIRGTPSKTERQKRNLDHLLDQIESTCWQSQFDNKIISKRLQKMSSQWDIDGQGIRIYENKKMDMTSQTLQMIKKIRMKALQIEEVEKQFISKDE